MGSHEILQHFQYHKETVLPPFLLTSLAEKQHLLRKPVQIIFASWWVPVIALPDHYPKTVSCSSSMKKNVNYLQHFNIEQWYEMHLSCFLKVKISWLYGYPIIWQLTRIIYKTMDCQHVQPSKWPSSVTLGLLNCCLLPIKPIYNYSIIFWPVIHGRSVVLSPVPVFPG